MKVDGNIGIDLATVAENAKEVEAAGYSGAWTAETSHDPFLPLLLAAEHTTEMEIGTSIAVAFARTPMTLANTAWDLQAYSKGRFVLGLGSQIKPHIEKRFSMEWSKPAARMREFVLAMRAIWNTWQTGEKLDFRGEFYTHTLMTPFFTPDKGELGDFGTPKVFLAGVGPLMTEVAGEVCDGFLCHGFTTEKFLREVTTPGARAWAGEGRQDHGGVRDRRPVVRRHRQQRRGDGAGRHRHATADRVLRLDARLPRGARNAWLGRSPGRAQHAVQAG